ncbi:MAG: ParB/RepB/Spo0J family partition protein [Patescibacteria group bacterium]
MPQFVNNAIFWIEIEKIKPNPYQPRKEFDPMHLQGLADSIRQYGVLQPLVATRKEVERQDGGLDVEYELIAGERRLRASKLAGIARVPVIIQSGMEDPRLKLELAIIENLQREDLNPVDRAFAFARLAQEFSFKHTEIAKKVGKSREYVSNSLRLLVLPQEVLSALSTGHITEGHARPLMMLADKKEEQVALFKEIVAKQLTVREAEQIARHIAHDRLRNRLPPDPEIEQIEKELAESLGTRVSIERRENGGKLVIDFFSSDDLRTLLSRVNFQEQHVIQTTDDISSAEPKRFDGKTVLETSMLPPFSPAVETQDEMTHSIDQDQLLNPPYAPDEKVMQETEAASFGTPQGDADPGLYSMKNFTI